MMLNVRLGNSVLRDGISLILIFLVHGVITVLYTLGAENLKEANFPVIYLTILCDLFGMVE